MAAKRNKLVLGLILFLYIAATPATSTSTCTVEFDTNYDGAKANNVYLSPRQPDWQSCRSFCKSNYPSAMYFKHSSTLNCACLTTKTRSSAGAGKTSGEVNCDNSGKDRSSVGHSHQKLFSCLYSCLHLTSRLYFLREL